MSTFLPRLSSHRAQPRTDVLRRLKAPLIPRITIYPIMPTGAPASFDLGDGHETPDGGTTWEVTDRPQRKGITTFQGYPPWRMLVPIMIDGYADDRDVGPKFQYLWKLQSLVTSPAAPNLTGGSAGPFTTEHPTVFRIGGPVSLTGFQWVLETIEIGDFIRNNVGALVRVACVLHLLEFVDVDLLVEQSPAKSAVERSGNTVGGVLGSGLGNPTPGVGSVIGGGL